MTQQSSAKDLQRSTNDFFNKLIDQEMLAATNAFMKVKSPKSPTPHDKLVILKRHFDETETPQPESNKEMKKIDKKKCPTPIIGRIERLQQDLAASQSQYESSQRQVKYLWERITVMETGHLELGHLNNVKDLKIKQLEQRLAEAMLPPQDWPYGRERLDEPMIPYPMDWVKPK